MKPPRIVRVKIVCMTCQRHAGWETWNVNPGQAAYDDPNPTTHGICPKCLTDFNRRARQQRAERRR